VGLVLVQDALAVLVLWAVVPVVSVVVVAVACMGVRLVLLAVEGAAEGVVGVRSSDGCLIFYSLQNCRLNLASNDDKLQTYCVGFAGIMLLTPEFSVNASSCPKCGHHAGTVWLQAVVGMAVVGMAVGENTRNVRPCCAFSILFLSFFAISFFFLVCGLYLGCIDKVLQF
jgi:hypothetical protein